MKTLLRELKPYKRSLILAPLLKMLEALANLHVPAVVKRLIDEGISSGDMNVVWPMIIELLIVAVLGTAVTVYAQYEAARAATGYSSRLRYVLFKRVQEMRFSELDRAGSSTLITRMTSDIDQVQNGVNLFLRLFLRSPFIVFGSMILAFVMDTESAVIFAVLVPLLLVFVFALMLYLMPVYKKVQAALDRVTLKTRENLTGSRVIRAFRLEKGEIRDFISDTDNLKRFQVFAGGVGAVMNPVTFMLLNAATIVLLYVGAVRVDRGLLTTGTLVALVNYMALILTELVKLANLVIQVTRAGASLNRIEEIMKPEAREEAEKAEDPDEMSADLDEEPIDPDAPEAGAPENVEDDPALSEQEAVLPEEPSALPEELLGIFDEVPLPPEALPDEEPDEDLDELLKGDIDPSVVRFDHVTLRYPGASENALSDVSFVVYSGESVGIIGGTGSGKTSLVSLIPVYYERSAGTVYVNGVPVEKHDLRTLRRTVTTVLQKPALFSGTVRDNLLFGLSQAEEKIISDEELIAALKAAAAYDFVMEKEGGLDAVCEQEGRNFSGGQRQRLAIARALLRKPEILILDDSSSALDFATDAEIRGNLRRTDEYMTVFVVSQRAGAVMHCDRILVLDGGRIVGEGTHENLMKDCGVYREIVASQFGEAGQSNSLSEHL